MNTWEFGVTNPDYMVKLAVTRDSCIPVAETVNSKINGGQCVLFVGTGL